VSTRSQTEKTTSPVYKRAASFRYCIYVDIGTISKTGCTFVDRARTLFSLFGNVTRSGLLWCSVKILPVYYTVAFC